MRTRRLTYLLLLIPIGLFVWFCIDFSFFQDDACISFRYAGNYLNGHGLVYNFGERVEGYTNFGWLLYLILCGVLGLDFVAWSQWAGIFFGAGLIALAAPLWKKLTHDSSAWIWLAPAMVLSANRSLAYWGQAGLETALFAFLTALSLYFYLRRNWLLVASITAAVLVRPEGALIAGLLILIELIVELRRPLFTAAAAGLALVCSLPFVGFKLAYYGSIIPNPFYAKTGFDVEQLQAGWTYILRFFSDYPYFAVGLLILPLFWLRLSRAVRAVWLFTLGYLAYIVVIGGDVLYVHRFFLPLLLPLALLLVLTLCHLARGLKAVFRSALVMLLALICAGVGVWLPYDFIDEYHGREMGLTFKMRFIAARLLEYDRTDFTLASPTIGSLGWHLLGHRLIDLVGLTDTTVARHPQEPFQYLESTWRERVYNTPYVLDQAPDFIIFSTGIKPSAPAERALILYPQFQDCYRGVSWEYPLPGEGGNTVGFVLFEKSCEPRPPYDSTFSPFLVNNYNIGINARAAGDYEKALRHFDRAIELGGENPYRYLLYFKSLALLQSRRYDEGYRIQNYLVAIDSTMYEPQADLYVYEYAIGNLAKAAIHRSWIERLAPWRLKSYDSIAEFRARNVEARRRQRLGQP
jgi:tetratricopeptide (TPR) repeat protein